MRVGEYERLPQRVLCSYGSTQSLRTSHHRGWLTVEDGLTRRPRSPVDGILQYPGYTVVIFRRRDQHRVRFTNRRLSATTGSGLPLSSMSALYGGISPRRVNI